MKAGRYQTATGMRAALEDRLNRMAREMHQDIMRLRRHVAFDRLLSRLFAKKRTDLVLKGGYGLELKLDQARSTKDIDISFNGTLDGAWAGPQAQPESLRGFIQELVSSDPFGDFFDFIIGKSTLDLAEAPYGGYRFPVESRLAGRVFVRFEIDFAAGDQWMVPHDTVKPKGWLGFAGIRSAQIPIISGEQQFAEKLHAYTRPREIQNSRVKDLVDMFVLQRKGNIDSSNLAVAVRKTFERRNSHPFPPTFIDPPANWVSPFSRLIAECGLHVGCMEAAQEIRQFCKDCDIVQSPGGL